MKKYIAIGLAVVIIAAGLFFLSLKKTADAAKEYTTKTRYSTYEESTKAIATNPKDMLAIRGLIYEHLKNHEYDKAMEWINKAYSIDPNDRETKLRHGLLLMQTKKYEEGTALFNELATGNDSIAEDARWGLKAVVIDKKRRGGA